jgi:hypothetical protein
MHLRSTDLHHQIKGGSIFYITRIVEIVHFNVPKYKKVRTQSMHFGRPETNTYNILDVTRVYILIINT